MTEPRLHHATLPCPLGARDVFLRLRGLRGCIWLDSARSNPAGDARYSLLAANPASRLRFNKGALERIDYQPSGAGESILRKALPASHALPALEQWLAQFGYKGMHSNSAAAHAEAPAGASFTNASTKTSAAADAVTFFGGGAVGYLSYDLGRQWEQHTPLPPVAQHFPQMDWALYESAVVCDQLHGTSHVVACSRSSDADAQQKAQDLLALLLKEGKPLTRMPFWYSEAADTACSNNAHASPARQAAYTAAVEQTRAYIAQGDIYQTNIAQYFSAPQQEHAADLYLRLRELNPAPYAAYLDTGSFQILSSSPELFLQKRGAYVRTRPIKGTRPRGRNAEADAQQRDALLHSEKERAELLMIVDLERNDLGRVCEPGSVKVESMYSVETYATVHHLMADVCGTLRTNTTLADLLRATFPGGSITGAPKVRAMEVIDELEQRERGIFYGAIGMIGLNGNLDLNIAIRTLLCAPDKDGGQEIHVAVGAGLVWDSDPQLEYEETLHKAEALLKVIHTQPDDWRLV